MEQIWTNIKNFFSEMTVDVGFRVIGAILIVIVGFTLSKLLVKLIRKSKLSAKVEPETHSFLCSAISILTKVLIIITAAAIVGVPTASILAVIGSAGLAVGLAMQGSLSNFAGGVMLIIFKPFKIGDYIEITGSQSGTVTDISIFYTTLCTFDNKKTVIPNSTVSNSAVTNYSANPLRRLDMDFSVSYSANGDLVSRVLIETARENALVLDDPAPFAGLKTFADSAIVYTLRVWCKAGDYWTLFFDLNCAMKKKFDANGISIPFPQVDVHFDPDAKAFPPRGEMTDGKQ